MREQQLEVLSSIYEYMERLYEGIQDAIDYFESQREGKAYELVVSIIDGLVWIVDGIHLTNDVHKAPIQLQEIKSVLGEVIEAQENNDTVLLCDMLKYEIMTKLEEWYNIIGNTLRGNEINETV